MMTDDNEEDVDDVNNDNDRQEYNVAQAKFVFIRLISVQSA